MFYHSKKSKTRKQYFNEKCYLFEIHLQLVSLWFYLLNIAGVIFSPVVDWHTILEIKINDYELDVVMAKCPGYIHNAS